MIKIIDIYQQLKKEEDEEDDDSANDDDEDDEAGDGSSNNPGDTKMKDKCDGFDEIGKCFPTNNDSNSSKTTTTKTDANEYVLGLIEGMHKLVCDNEINPEAVADAFVTCYTDFKFGGRYKGFVVNEDDAINVDNLSDYPVLHASAIPLRKTVLNPLLRDIVALSRLHPDKNLLSYKSKNDRVEYTLIDTFRWKSKEACIKFSNQRKNSCFLQHLPGLIHNDGNEKAGANWMISYYGHHHEDEFVAVCEELGYPVLTHKMPAATAAAMWQDANISLTAQRIILRYLHNEFGRRLVVPESMISKYGEEHVCPDCEIYVTECQKKYTIGRSL